MMIAINDVRLIVTGYPIMQFYLNKTGHPMLFSCEWPLYENRPKIKVVLVTHSYRCVGTSSRKRTDLSKALIIQLAPFIVPHSGPGGWGGGFKYKTEGT